MNAVLSVMVGASSWIGCASVTITCLKQPANEVLFAQSILDQLPRAMLSPSRSIAAAINEVQRQHFSLVALFPNVVRSVKSLRGM